MAKKKQSTGSAKNDPPQPSRTRSARRFPALTFEEALALPDAIQRYAAGQRVRRLTLFEKLDQAPEGNKARRLITGAGQYGLTKGNYSSEFIELTTEGREATGDDVPPVQKLTIRFNLAIDRIEPFKFLYEKIRGNKLPAREIMADYLAEIRVEEDERPECIDIFVLNVKFLGLLRTIAGSERLVTLDHAMENATDIVKASPVSPASELSRSIASPASGGPVSSVAGNDYGKVCFYISPIGEGNSEPRRHSDFLMEYIIDLR